MKIGFGIQCSGERERERQGATGEAMVMGTYFQINRSLPIGESVIASCGPNSKIGDPLPKTLRFGS